MEPNEIVIAENPRSGDGRGRNVVSELAERLNRRGYSVISTQVVDTALTQASKSLQNGKLRAVVIAGGDGTISLLANRLPIQCPMALLPLGTENLLAKYLGIEVRSAAATEALIESSESVDLDVGQANGRLFLVMAGIGFDAEVVRRLHRNRRGHIRHWSYFWPIWNAIRLYSYPRLSISVDGVAIEPRPSWAFVFNVPRYAMNLQIVPEANAVDGKLDLRTFRKGNLLSGLWYVGAVLLGRHRNLKDATYRQAKQITITADVPVPLQLDGDPAGTTPVEIQVIPRRLRVLAPKHFLNLLNRSKEQSR